MLPGKDTPVKFGARVTLAALARGGVFLSLTAALSSCCVVDLRGRYPARRAAATSTIASSKPIIKRLGELPLGPNIIPPLEVVLLFHQLLLQSPRQGSEVGPCAASYT